MFRQRRKERAEEGDRHGGDLTRARVEPRHPDEGVHAADHKTIASSSTYAWLHEGTRATRATPFSRDGAEL